MDQLRAVRIRDAEDLPLFSRAIINPVISVDLLAVCVNGAKAFGVGANWTAAYWASPANTGHTQNPMNRDERRSHVNQTVLDTEGNCSCQGIRTRLVVKRKGGVTSVPTATSPAKIVGGFFSNVVSALMKWLWYLKATATSAPFVLSCLFAAVLGL
ncbi:hypothetical protein D5086_018086 [Populus alba]|uniref:Uncharacterized protein n=1 Tax=Populus alba TaxID=43335 RepID=A0ACC4BQD6_POPAL